MWEYRFIYVYSSAQKRSDMYNLFFYVIYIKYDFSSNILQKLR